MSERYESGTSSSTTGTGEPDRLDSAVVKLGLILVIGAMASILDTTIVSVAIAGLAREFNTSLATIQWVATAYLLALAMVIPLTGWLMDRFGAKTMWMLSLGLFLLGSVLAGASWSVGSLIVFRAFQGLGGGMILPIAQTILAQAAGPQRLGRVMSIVGIPAQVAPILGPVVGGLIIDTVNWRWIFYVNVPLCLLALALAWRGVPATPRKRGERLDLLGLVLLSPGFAALVYGLSQMDNRNGFDQTVYLPIALGVLLLGWFTVRALRMRGTPILDVRLFADRTFASANAVMFLLVMSIYGAILLLPLYYQQVRLASALDAGTLLAPQFVGMIIAVLLAGKPIDRVGPRLVALVGMAVGALGSLAYLWVGPDTNEVLLGASLVLRGIGLGAASVAGVTAAYQLLPQAALPRATSALNIVQRIASPVGAAVLAIVLQHEITVHGGPNASPQALGHAFAATFWWPFVFVLAAIPFALRLPRPARRAA